nr:beta-galactosidase trimerization domain-containing protein [Halomonas socia]
MNSHKWLDDPLVMIMTMREGDAARWDPDKLVDFAKSFSVDAFGFSVGGITAFYPTEIPLHPHSSSLGDRDLVGETVDALKRNGLRAIARIDASLARKELVVEHPEWFARDKSGALISVHGHYVACPNGGHYRTFMVQVVEEILLRYAFDGLWANAAQFSPWHTPQCHCANCRAMFKAEHGHAIPNEDWNDPVWRTYNEWRYRQVADWSALMRSTIDAVRPDCAWLPLSQVAESWDHARRGGWDVDYTEPHQQAMVLEAQRRYTNFWWPGLEARYLHNIEGHKPGHVTVSYFLPWWRLYRAPTPENKIWTAQILAQGARPWLHITGYFSEQFDRRGLESFQELFKLFKSNPDAYVGTRSQAEVALVYSRHSLDNYGHDDPENRYLNHFRGYYNAMLEGRIAFDILSDKRLTRETLSRYKCVVLPNAACISDAACDALAEYADTGGHVIATYKSGFYDAMGNERAESLISRLTGATYTGHTWEGMQAAYGAIKDRNHLICEGLGDTDLIPLTGDLCFFDVDRQEPAPITFVPPVEGEVGSGISVPEFNQITSVTEYPLVIERRASLGKITYFPWQPDWMGYRYGLRDCFLLLGNAVRSTPDYRPQVEIEGPGLLDVSLMSSDDRSVLHIVNFSSPGSFNSGHRRSIEEILPLHDLCVRVRIPKGRAVTDVRPVVGHLANGYEYDAAEGRVVFRLSRIEEFESIVIGHS